MSINIITNVSHYKLLENLISNIKLNSTNPFKKQTIVIQSNGMARWLSLNIADKFNITANINFLFPYKLLILSPSANLRSQSIYNSNALRCYLVLPG